MSKRGEIDWGITKGVLETIQEINPAFTTENYLIGGSAAWFYKTFLEKESDPDFPAPTYTQEENNLWYSKDIDFLGTKREDLPRELQTRPEGDPPIVKINGIWIDSPNEGVFITRENAAKTALEAENPETGGYYKVASPTLLYKEKKRLGEMWKAGSRPQDALHKRALKTAARLLLCKLAENKGLNQKQAALLFKLLKETQEIAPEIFASKPLLKRLGAQTARLKTNPRTKAIYHLLKNQILKEAKPGPELG